MSRHPSSPSWTSFVSLSSQSELADTVAQRPRPKLLPLLLATLPVSQHLAVIALFLAVFYGMLVGDFGADEVGWMCAMVGVVAYTLWRVGWGITNKSVGRESCPRKSDLPHMPSPVTS